MGVLYRLKDFKADQIMKIFATLSMTFLCLMVMISLTPSSVNSAPQPLTAGYLTGCFGLMGKRLCIVEVPDQEYAYKEETEGVAYRGHPAYINKEAAYAYRK